MSAGNDELKQIVTNTRISCGLCYPVGTNRILDMLTCFQIYLRVEKIELMKSFVGGFDETR